MPLKNSLLRYLQLAAEKILPRSIFSMYWVVVFEMADAGGDANHEAEWVTDDLEREQLATLTGNHLAGSRRSDHHTVGIRRGDEFVGGLWAVPGAFEEVDHGICFDIETSDAWLYCAFVEREFRNQGIYQQVLQLMIQKLRDKGYVRQFLAVNVGAHVSEHVHRTRAKREVGRIRVIRFLNRLSYRSSGDLVLEANCNPESTPKIRCHFKSKI